MWNIIVLALACTTAAASQTPQDKQKSNIYHVPSFSISSLTDTNNSRRLKDALSSSGIIAITPSNPNEYEMTSKKALRSLCHCQYDVNHNDDYMSYNIMADGTHRTTIGTGTLGGWNHPLPLSHSIADVCHHDTNKDSIEDMEHLRDLVMDVSQAFVHAVDQLLLPQQQQGQQQEKIVLMEDTHGTSYTSLKGIIQGSTSLEHFHLYDKPTTAADSVQEDDEDDSINTIALHTDAGLFLSFVPAHPCDDDYDKDNDDDDAFYVEIDGTLRQAIYPPNSVIIMLGSGMEHWVHHHSEDVSFRATKHAVKMNNKKKSSSRAWYGMMHLVPPDAIIQRYPTIQTFNDMRSSMSLSSRKQSASLEDNNVITIGCGTNNHQQNIFEEEDNILPTKQHRRLQHVSGPQACNNVTQFMCWLICLDIPDHTNAISRLREGESLYCLDPSIYAKTGGSISQAVKPCSDDDGVMGNVMNDACMGSWLPATSHLVPGFSLEVDGKNIATLSDEDVLRNMDDQYCHGGTSMYMDGFNWKGTTCVVYLFQSWVLSSQAKLIVACLGTIVAAVLLEYIILSRRVLVTRVPVGYTRLLTSTALYGTQMTLGYFVMLVVMTYSGPLFLCVVLGLMVGHVCTNKKRLLTGKNELCCEGVVQDGITPCCQYDVGTDDDDEGEEGGGSSSSKDGTRARSKTKDVSSSDEEIFRDEDIKPCCSAGVPLSDV